MQCNNKPTISPESRNPSSVGKMPEVTAPSVELSYDRVFALAEKFLTEISTVQTKDDGSALADLKAMLDMDSNLWPQIGSTILRILEYTPGIGLVVSIGYWARGKREEAIAAFIRHTNGIISCGAVVGGIFLPVLGSGAIILAYAALGAAGSGIGMAVEAMLADAYIQDPDVRASLASFTFSEVLTSILLGAICGAAVGVVSKVAVGDMLRLVERTTSTLFLSPEKTCKVVLGSIQHLDYTTLLSFLVKSEMTVLQQKLQKEIIAYNNLPSGNAEKVLAKKRLRRLKEKAERCKQSFAEIDFPTDLEEGETGTRQNGSGNSTKSLDKIISTLRAVAPGVLLSGLVFVSYRLVVAYASDTTNVSLLQ